jgi:hypothetical protein
LYHYQDVQIRLLRSLSRTLEPKRRNDNRFSPRKD